MSGERAFPTLAMIAPVGLVFATVRLSCSPVSNKVSAATHLHRKIERKWGRTTLEILSGRKLLSKITEIFVVLPLKVCSPGRKATDVSSTEHFEHSRTVQLF